MHYGHVFRVQHRLLEIDDLVKQIILAAGLSDLDELDELNADAGLVVLEESRNWNPMFGPLVALYEDDIVAALAFWDVLARETAKALTSQSSVTSMFSQAPSTCIENNQIVQATTTTITQAASISCNQLTRLEGLVPWMEPELPAWRVRCNFDSSVMGARPLSTSKASLLGCRLERPLAGASFACKMLAIKPAGGGCVPTLWYKTRGILMKPTSLYSYEIAAKAP